MCPVVDLTFRTERATSYAEICDRMKSAADNELRGVFRLHRSAL